MLICAVRDISRAEKVGQLTKLSFLSSKILYPAVDYSSERGLINELEAKVLKKAVENGTIKAGDLRDVLPELKSAQIPHQPPIRAHSDGRKIWPQCAHTKGLSLRNIADF